MINQTFIPPYYRRRFFGEGQHGREYNEVQAKIQTLCEHFEITKPDLWIKPKNQRARYWNPNTRKRRPRGRIVLTGTDEWVMLHEFAHHLNYHKYGGRNHDKYYKRALWKTVMFYYDGDPTKYRWDLEYTRVRQYGCGMILAQQSQRSSS